MLFLVDFIAANIRVLPEICFEKSFLLLVLWYFKYFKFSYVVIKIQFKITS